ncbi:unnamed protein product [Meganyctiphanes norvegica]|uniref:Uncharacterized protein n=1 Tax=Meganyctiphanes norvegica TaxID=48144 RepID=A0AAV2RX61_MEGNR
MSPTQTLGAEHWLGCGTVLHNKQAACYICENAWSYGGGVSNRWSVGTGDSGPSLVNLDHHLALLEDVAPTNVHTSFRASNLVSSSIGEDHGGGESIPLSVSNNLGGPERELPPPYNANHSTLIAVRSSSHYAAAASAATLSNNNSSTYNNNLSSNRPPSPTTPPPSVVSSNGSSFPSYLQQRNSRLSSCNTSATSSPLPQHQHNNNHHNSYTASNNENYCHGLASFLPSPSDTSMSSISTSSFSLRLPPTPLTLHSSQNHQSNINHQVCNNSNVDHHQLTSIHHQHRNNFAPVLSPTMRPCSTAHIKHTHQTSVNEEQLYTATKF